MSENFDPTTRPVSSTPLPGAPVPGQPMPSPPSAPPNYVPQPIAVPNAPPSPTAPPMVRTQSTPQPPPAPASVAGEDETFADEPMPLLPRGDAIFDDIPARAVVLEELAPALENGALVVRRPNGVGIVLVRNGTLFEKFCFHDSGERRYGEAALTEIKLWLDAGVSAFRLKPEVVDIAPVLLRGDHIYEDLRLSWTNWKQLLADLRSRQGTYVVELQTKRGRGVTCIARGQQIATFTSAHPEFGEPSLLDELAGSGNGKLSVRCEPAREVNDLPEANQPATSGTKPAADVAGTTNPFEAAMAKPTTPPSSNGDFSNNPFEVFGGTGPVTPEDGHDPIDVPVSVLLPELKDIARNRLQRSSPRVEAMLDDAAASDKPLEAVLAEIRGLVIRGVMQSTLDGVVDEMMSAATARAAS